MFQLIGIDGDDTLWHSEGYYRAANATFKQILADYVDVDDTRIGNRLLAAERSNLAIFGYGAKGMALAMVETAIALTDARISATDIHRVIALGKQVLAHPVELLPGVIAMLDALGERAPLVLITKGDLWHQEQKIAQSGLADRFARIEIVSEKSAATYRRILSAANVAPAHFAMVGNALRSDIEPVLRLGGWAVHVPYRLTWAHEQEHRLAAQEPRMLTAAVAADVPSAIASLAAQTHAAGCA